MMKKIAGGILAVVILVSLTACGGDGKTFTQRAHDKQVCEAAGGIYVEYPDPFALTKYDHNYCDLSTRENN